MKKIFALFMIFLVLFNFYACTKQSIVNPINNPNDKNLEILFIDNNGNISKNKTDRVLMKVKDDDSGFYMLSEKKSQSEYVSHLIDTKNSSSISMYYKNGELFPHKILLVKDNESTTGYTSYHRKDSEDFDIVWHSEDDYETSKNIPLKNQVYNHSKTTGVDSDTDYQIKITKISVRISEAINQYMDKHNNTNISVFKARISWKSVASFWRSIFTPIIVIVAVIISIFVPPIAPIIGYIATPLIAISPILAIVAAAENKEKAASGKKELIILNSKNNGKQYINNEIIHLNNRCDSTNIYFDVTEAELDTFGINMVMENESNGYSLINTYYGMKYNDKNCSVSNNNVLVGKTKLNNNQDFNIKITKNYNDVGNNNININIYVGENTFINGNVRSSFKLILKP